MIDYKFSPMPMVVLTDTEVSSEAKGFLAYLYGKSGGKGLCYIRQKKMAEEYGVKFTYLKTLIAELKGMMLIRIQQRNRTAYTHLVPINKCYTDTDNHHSPLTDACIEIRSTYKAECEKKRYTKTAKRQQQSDRKPSGRLSGSLSCRPSGSLSGQLSQSLSCRPLLELDRETELEAFELEAQLKVVQAPPSGTPTALSAGQCLRKPANPNKGDQGETPRSDSEDVAMKTRNTDPRMALEKKAGGKRQKINQSGSEKPRAAVDANGEPIKEKKARNKTEPKSLALIHKLWAEWKALLQHKLDVPIPGAVPRGADFGHLKNIIMYMEGDYEKALKVITMLVEDWSVIKQNCFMAERKPVPDLHLADQIKDQLYGCVSAGKSFRDVGKSMVAHNVSRDRGSNTAADYAKSAEEWNRARESRRR